MSLRVEIKGLYIELMLKTKDGKNTNAPLKATDEPLKNAKQTERRKQIEMLMQKNIRISKEILAEQLSISISTIKREMKALGYKWVGHSANGYWKKQMNPNNYAE